VKTLFFLALAAAAPAASDHPKTFLASIEGVLLKSGESIDKFQLDTWGVDYKAVCQIPADWEITAGSFGPGGRLAGEAGHGASQLRAGEMKSLREIVLISLAPPVQKRDRREGTGVVPATFDGFAHVQSGWTESSRKVRLTFSNVKLTPARACPSPNQR
jgi:hypothetical protein